MDNRDVGRWIYGADVGKGCCALGCEWDDVRRDSISSLVWWAFGGVGGGVWGWGWCVGCRGGDVVVLSRIQVARFQLRMQVGRSVSVW